MLRNIFLVSLLVYAVCAAQWEIRKVDSAEDQDEEISADGMPEQQMAPECILCKAIVSIVKAALSSKPTVDEIKSKLSKGCTIFKDRKAKCTQLIEKYTDKLVKALETSDAPNVICTKLFICN